MPKAARCAWSCSASSCPASNPSHSTIDAPFASIGVVSTCSPPVWNSGVYVTVLSADVRSSATIVFSALNATWRYGSSAPFGCPVVPDV